jgi:hypothetical protein
MVNAKALHEDFGGVDPGEGLDDFVGEAFALETCPGPGGVDALEMASAVELAGEFKVMKDTEDRLNDSHSARGRLTSVHRNKGLLVYLILGQACRSGGGLDCGAMVSGGEEPGHGPLDVEIAEGPDKSDGEKSEDHVRVGT